MTKSFKRALAQLPRIAAGTVLSLGLCAAIYTAPAHAAEAKPSPAPAASPASPTVTQEGPALWVVRDADSTVYLFGSLHVLRPETQWRTARIDAALDSASDVWFEITNPDDHAGIGAIMQTKGMDPSRPLSSLMTPEQFAAFDTAARAMGGTAAQMDTMRPWLAAFMVAMGPLTKAGFNPATGVDIVLRDRAVAAGKSVHGFETADSQINLIANASEEAQLAYLNHSVSTADTAAADLDQMIAAWARGNTSGVARYNRENTGDVHPELHQVMLARRNANWADQIVERMKGSGTSFVVVGAAHLSGPDNVPDLLAARGLSVTRN